MKRIFVRTSIVLVGMITWLLPNRADALRSRLKTLIFI